MSNALTRRSHVVLGCLIGILFAGNLSASDRHHHYTSLRHAEPGEQFGPSIQIENWGAFGNPVTGTTEPTPGYEGVELFAGPQKFKDSGDDDYFHGVLPNGRIVKPAGLSTQVGMNPLGIALTPDGKFAIVSNDDERKGDLVSLQNTSNHGGYSLSVLDTSTTPMTVVSQINSTKRLFIGLAAAMNPDGTYTVYASGGGDNSVKLFNVTSKGQISQANNPVSIPIAPLLPSTQGWVSNYKVSDSFNLDAVPSPASNPKRSVFGLGAKITFPAGCTLTHDGRYLLVACDGDNSVAVIETASKKVVAQYKAGYFPYAVAVSPDNRRFVVSNWGVTTYKFAAPSYDSDGKLASIGATTGPGGEPDEPAGFFVPKTDDNGATAKTSSLSVFHFQSENPAKTRLSRAIAQGRPLDALRQVGDTHPSAMAIVTRENRHVLYVTRTNDDSLGVVDLDREDQARRISLPWVQLAVSGNQFLTGTYPNALVASHDGRKLYVAEGGINAVAILDLADPFAPKLIGRIPTGWWPSALVISPDDKFLYIVNAKGIGEDINPAAARAEGSPSGTGVESFEDSNFIFGTVQKVAVSELKLHENRRINDYNVAKIKTRDESVVPIGGMQPSKKIKCVIFIEHENKSFDSILGESAHFKPFASTTFHHPDGSAFDDAQYGPVTRNTRLLAETFATAVNYYSDSEESDAGHQFCASGTATDYTEKTLLVKEGRGLLVNKNMEPEDYPASGYIFNNAARNEVSFKDYGELVRIGGTDTGNSLPNTFDDPTSGRMGYPVKQEKNPVEQFPGSDVDSKTQGLGQAYFLDLPMLAILGANNKNGEPHLDKNYPGYNFNISDQRRALEFIHDFDRMTNKGTLPRFLYIYLPNDHTGETTADFGTDPKTGKPIHPEPAQQVEDGDVALGMVVEHIMESPVYYDRKTDTGAAIFITFDDAQATHDHIHPHRTPMILVSPFAKPGYLGRQHYSTASIVKTEELLLGLPPNNIGDLVATDLHDLFQPNYNHIEIRPGEFNRVVDYKGTPAGQEVWALVSRLDTAEPDQDSPRLGTLARLSMKADSLYYEAENNHRLNSDEYLHSQRELMHRAEAVVSQGEDDE